MHVKGLAIVAGIADSFVGAISMDAMLLVSSEVSMHAAGSKILNIMVWLVGGSLRVTDSQVTNYKQQVLSWKQCGSRLFICSSMVFSWSCGSQNKAAL